MQKFKGSKILVVGGAGFVGSNLVKKLLAYEPLQIVVIDNLLSAERENLPEHKALSFIEGSITDDKILHELQDDFAYIFHLATFHGNGSSIHDPLADHANNTLTTLKLFEHIHHFKQLKKVVYSSAGCVAAEKTFSQAQATTEETMPSLYLDSPYQISKLIGELYANYYFKQKGLPVVKARFQNVYGPGEVLGAGQWRGTPATIWRNVVPIFIYQSLHQLALTVENGGIATRDFIHVDDICHGLMLCALNGEPGENYNLASGVETSIKELATLINQFTNNNIPIALKPKRDWDHSGMRYGCTEKSKDKLGFVATTDLAAGLQQTIAWTQANMSRIEACIAKHSQHLESA